LNDYFMNDYDRAIYVGETGNKSNMGQLNEWQNCLFVTTVHFNNFSRCTYRPYNLLNITCFTTWTSDRFFSKLNITKYCLRISISQQRLNCLGLLSIDTERARSMHFDIHVDIISEHKSKKKFFSLIILHMYNNIYNIEKKIFNMI
jgi:hypothetical protein